MKTYLKKSANHSLLLIHLFLIIVIFTSCEKEKSDPVIVTISIEGLNPRQYLVTAKIEKTGDYEIFDHGFTYYLGNSYSSYSKLTLSKGKDYTNVFSDTITLGDLSYFENYKLFVNAYLTNERGTIFSTTIFSDLLRVSLQSISPASGNVGDTVSLIGVNFDPVLQNNIVGFGYSYAQVISGNSKLLKVIVPEPYYSSDNNPDVSVSSNGFSSTLERAFFYVPKVEGFSPKYGSWHNSITIAGYSLRYCMVYFDDEYITTNNYSSNSFSFNIPSSFKKKQFKIFILANGIKQEVPGGYFTMSDLVVNNIPEAEVYKGGTISLFGANFNPDENYLFLGDNLINSEYSYSDFSRFYIPYSFPLGTYDVRFSNGIDTILFQSTVTVVGK